MQSLLLAAAVLLVQQDPNIQVFKNKNAAPDLRVAAAKLIGAGGSWSSIPVLKEGLKDKNGAVRSAAHDALKEITGVTDIEPTAWDEWWNNVGSKMPFGDEEATKLWKGEIHELRESIDDDQKDLRNYINISMGLVGILWLVFIIALIYFAGHLSSKLKEWKDVMKQADQYLRESEEVTKRTDRIIDELEAKKAEIVDFFSKLKDDNESELERFADLLEQNTEHRIRLEMMALRQKAEKELGQTLGELKTGVDHEIRRSVNEYRGKAERDLDGRQKIFMQQIEAHSLFIEAAFFTSQGRGEDALRVYKKLLDVKPDHHVALTNMGNVLREMLRFDEALDSYRRALEFSPSDGKVYYNMALTYARMKRRESMLTELARAFENNGEDLKDEALNEPAFKPYWNDAAFKDLAEG